jgi:hypothetical protein
VEEREAADIEVERRERTERQRRPAGAVRDEDLEPHAGLRYIARLFKVLALILVLLLVAEIVVGLVQAGTAALMTLMVEATRLIVFAAFLWAAADLTLMFIDSNHDLRATRILVGRLNGKVDRLVERDAGGPPPLPPPPPPPPPA